MRRLRGTDRRAVALGAAVLGGGIALLLRENMRARRLERAISRRLRLGADGIIVGAQPETLRGSDTHAVLVLHGFGDTPQSVRELAHSLHAHGWSVEVPLLPGHGRTLAEFGIARSHDWIGHTRDQVARLCRSYKHVSLVGLSMGAALCAIVAAERDDLDALVMLSPYLSMPTYVRRLAPLLRVSGKLAPFRASTGRTPSIYDPAAESESLGFGVISGHLLAELHDVTSIAREAMPHVAVPTLYMAARNDSRVPVNDTLRNWRHLQTTDREFRLLEQSGHIMTVDYEKQIVFAETARWLSAHAGLPQAGVPQAGVPQAGLPPSGLPG